MASLAPEVLAACLASPETAQRLLTPAGWALAEMVVAVARSLGWSSGVLPLSAAGGFLLSAAAVLQAMTDALTRQGYQPAVTLVPDPVRGAVLLAERGCPPSVGLLSEMKCCRCNRDSSRISATGRGGRDRPDSPKAAQWSVSSDSAGTSPEASPAGWGFPRPRTRVRDDDKARLLEPAGDHRPVPAETLSVHRVPALDRVAIEPADNPGPPGAR